MTSLEMGGMENGVVNIARGLPPGRFETHVCCLERTGPFAQRLPQPENVHVLHKPPGFSPRAAWQLNRLIARLQPDIVHSHNVGPLIYSGLGTVLGTNCRLLHGEHFLPQAKELSAKRVWQRRIFYAGCRKVHAVSDGVRLELVKAGVPGRKIVTLLNGVNHERFQPGDKTGARKKIGLVPADAVVLGMVGRFAPEKNQTVLVEAFDRVAAKRPELHLLLIGGGGPCEEQVRAAANACASAARIHFTGYQSDVLPFYQALDALVFPSTREGLSNAVLEAMACGLAVLAHPSCGTPEVITDGLDGILAELDSREKLQLALEHFLAAPEKFPALALAAREKIVRDFSLTGMVENYRRLYLSVIED